MRIPRALGSNFAVDNFSSRNTTAAEPCFASSLWHPFAHDLFMIERDGSALNLDCHTCLAANTTACSDCVVAHVLANDDGPIELISTGLVIAAASDPALDHAVNLLAKADLLDAEPVWVDRSVFELSTTRPRLVAVR